MPSPTHPYQELRFPDELREPPPDLEPHVSNTRPMFCRLDGTPCAPHSTFDGPIMPALWTLPTRRVGVWRPLPRVRRESHGRRPGHRRSGKTSTTSSSDPGDDGPLDEHPRRGELRHVAHALGAFLLEIGGTR